MQLCIRASEASRNEFLQKNINPGITILWQTTINDFVNTKADVYFDLSFENDQQTIHLLKSLLPAPVFVNAVTDTLSEIAFPFIRINAWPGFLKNPVTEIAVSSEKDAEKVTLILNEIGWKFKIVPDEPGMIAARVIAMIVNEAYFALGEDVSSKEEIDTAMKLGTNYPQGPFEWSQQIGLPKIEQLLSKLSITDQRYIVSPTLINEVKATN